MSEKIPYSNPLIRDGESQADRLLKALLPEYVKIDERTREDLIRFAQKFASLIQYYDTNNHRTDSWKIFFNEYTKPDQPHYALFLAFVYVFRYAQNDVNTITARHLNHYYKDILRLTTKPALPDTVHLLFALAKNVDSHRIEKGTLLKAGKDNSGKDLFYATDKELVVNRTRVASLKTIFQETFVQSDNSLKKVNGYGLYAAPIANSTDGLGTEQGAPDLHWKIFGESQNEKIKETTLPKAETGFAIASPILFLKEGNRTITLLFTFDISIVIAFIPYFFSNVLGNHNVNYTDVSSLQSILTRDLNSTPLTEDETVLLAKVAALLKNPASSDITSAKANKKVLEDNLRSAFSTALKDAFSISLSGEKEWIGPILVSGKRESDRQIKIEIRLDNTIAPIVAYNAEKLGGRFETSSPLLKVLLHQGNEETTPNYIYSFLKGIQLVSVDIDVTVSDVKNLILQNDSAILDASKPFLPFGPVPVIGSSLYIGSEEAFQKKLKTFTLRFSWFNVPATLSDHYDAYNTALQDGSTSSTAPSIKNESFSATLELLHNLKWKPISITEKDNVKSILTTRLFEEDATRERSVVVPASSNLSDCEWPSSTKTLTRYDNNTLTGFIRLQLKGAVHGAFKAFGHTYFPKLYTETILKKVNNPDGTYALPNEPYTPLLQGLSLDYTSTAYIKIGRQQPASREQFFHLSPFGFTEMNLTDTSKSSISLVPVFDDEGTLYIGLADLKAPQNISLLFQLNEKNINHEFVGKVEITWSYLSNNQWIQFSEKEILEDTTDLFTKSGIVVFSVPKAISSGNTLLPENLYWIRATVPANTLGVADAVSINAQTVTATFVDLGNAADHLSTPLAADSIKKFKINETAIKSIQQPYASFDGQLKETDEMFYQRVSERLRHKRRAISIWDYERLILAAFPTIYKVKCLNHTYFPAGATCSCTAQMTPGAVTLIVITQITEDTALENKLAPIVNVLTLNKIKSYLASITSPFITQRQQLVVRNPSYERVKVKCSVKFHQGYDTGYYLKELDTDIKKFLAPWAFSPDSTITFERKIYKSVLIDYIEELSYVNFVCCFQLFHLIDDKSKEVDSDSIEASHPAAILISNSEHSIRYVEGDVCDCNEKEEDIDPIPVRGIGVMIVDIDFKVS